MTQAKSNQHIVDVSWLVNWIGLKDTKELLIVKIYIGNDLGNRSFHAIVAICFLANHHIFETHIVTSKCPGFIWEDMLDLA
jgi:hypothetical protein